MYLGRTFSNTIICSDRITKIWFLLDSTFGLVLVTLSLVTCVFSYCNLLLSIHHHHHVVSYSVITKEENVLLNDALNTFYLRLYGVRHMVKNHSDRERGNPLLPHRLLFSISNKGYFICIIPQTG